MAERRMFAKTIIDSDAFIDMPVTARLLYYDLAMRADDDGFVNAPKKIMRMVGASQDDLTLLCAKRFVIPFESGIVVIKHWRVHNYIQRDRYKPTKYEKEKALLSVKDNGVYTLDTKCIQDVSEMDTQVRLGKVRLGKDNISGAKAPERTHFIPPTLEDVQAYCKETGKMIDAEAFVSYYGSQNWKKANGQKLSDWKLAVCQWYRKDKGNKQRSYNVDDLEAESMEIYK